MNKYPHIWVGFRKGWWFHNLIVILDRLDHVPKPLFLIAAALALAAASMTWPGWRPGVVAVSALALIIEERAMAWGQRTLRAPTPFGGPFSIFSLGHAGAAAAVGFIPLPLSGLFALHILVQSLLVAAMLYASLVEPFKVGFSELEIDLPTRRHFIEDGAPEKTSLKILLISDLHLEYKGTREEQVLRLAREFGPDLVLFPGDFTNLSFVGQAGAREELREIIKELCSLAPVYASRGTYEVDRRDWVDELLQDTGAVLLDHESCVVRVKDVELCLIGIPYMGREKDRVASLDRLLSGADGKPVVLLHHSPDLIEHAAGRNVSLYVAGHTHGGQIRLPFIGALYTSSRFGQKYARGTHRLDNTHLVVSQGVGLEGAGAPRMRFLSPPEIVGINLIMS